MNREQLDQAADAIRADFEVINKARDQAYQRSRRLIGMCARTIRAIHREEWQRADELIAEAGEAAEALVAGVDLFPNLYYAGYT